jgi:hypothetical protein
VSVTEMERGQARVLTPCAHYVIFRDGEDDVAVGIIFDLGERALVPREENGSHLGGVSVVRSRRGGGGAAVL